MSDDTPPRRSYSDLSRQEKKSVDTLLRLAREWPNTIGLFSWSGNLVVTDRRKVITDFLGEHPEHDGEIRTIDDIRSVTIPNDGGDPSELQ